MAGLQPLPLPPAPKPVSLPLSSELRAELRAAVSKALSSSSSSRRTEAMGRPAASPAPPAPNGFSSVSPRARARQLRAARS